MNLMDSSLLTKASSTANTAGVGRSIGAILIDTGRLSAENAERILRVQKEQGTRFGDAAIKLGLLGNLVGAVDRNGEIAGQQGLLVGSVADETLRAGEQKIHPDMRP